MPPTDRRLFTRSPAALVAALELLDRAGVTIRLSDGNVKLAVPPDLPDWDLIRAPLIRHRALLVAVALGRGGSIAGLRHDLIPCSVCGEPSMVAVTASRLDGKTRWPACRMTSGCEGRHQPGQRVATAA